MVLAGDANRLSLFMNYLDGEIAKRMMRLFPNRWGPKFWSGRFKEQHLPTVDSVLNKIEYLFCNPLRARLVSRLASYPGISSFQDFSSLGNKSGTLCSFTFPRFFKRIKERVLSRKRDIEIATELQKNSEGLLELKTNLFGWVHCFKEKRERKVVLEQLCRRIAQAEKEAKAKGAIEAKRLITQPFDKPYYPEKKKRDRTPFVDCPDEELRKVFIAKYQEFRAECRSAWEKVKSGLTALCPTLWPRGAFIPGGLFPN
jgi:hypothetical protein